MSKTKIKVGNMYACHHGEYAGQLFAFICRDKKEQTYDFDEGLEKEIIKFVEKIPKYVYKVIELQYKKNENTNNRRK